LRKDAPVTSAMATVDQRGQLRARITPPPGVFGLATVRITEAYVAMPSGTIRSNSEYASVYIHPTRLDVRVSGQLRHRPGDRAQLDVQVRDQRGRPVAGAGVSASVIDERILALSEPQLDLIEILEEMDVRKARAAGIAFTTLLTGPDTPAARAAMRAIIESLPPSRVRPHVHFSASARIAAENRRLRQAYDAVYDTLLVDANPIGRQLADGKWDFSDSLAQVLTRAKWTAERQLTPWRLTTTWSYARQLNSSFKFAYMARSLARDRLHKLAPRLQRRVAWLRRDDGFARLKARGLIPAHLQVDPWGSAIVLRPAWSVDGDRPGTRRRRIIDRNNMIYSLISPGPD
ncbi:MAG: hypothetical protein AAGC55_34185, partial [Myxococcota bacterium]